MRRKEKPEMDEEEMLMPNEIWIFAEQQDGRIKKTTFELLSAGGAFSKKTGQALAAVLLGHSLEEAVKHLTPFADKIYALESAAFTPYISDTYLAALQPLVQEHQPSILLGARVQQEKIFSLDWQWLCKRVTPLTARG